MSGSETELMDANGESLSGKNYMKLKGNDGQSFRYVFVDYYFLECSFRKKGVIVSVY